MKITRTNISILLSLILVMGMAVLSAFDKPQPVFLEANQTRVINVIDGDTIEIESNNVKQKVRLLGIDTPEKNHPSKPVECFANEATAYLKNLISSKQVTLEKDSSQTDKDRYGRLIRYVYVGNQLINLKMINDGYAYEYTYQKPYLKQADFKAAQTEAKSSSRGLWATNTCNGQR